MPDKAEGTSVIARNLDQNGKIFPATWKKLGTLAKEKKNTWAEGCKESSRRETEIHTVLESMADDAKVEDGDTQAQENLEATPQSKG